MLRPNRKDAGSRGEDAGVEPIWAEKISRRLAEYRSGKVTFIAGAEVTEKTLTQIGLRRPP